AQHLEDIALDIILVVDREAVERDVTTRQRQRVGGCVDVDHALRQAAERVYGEPAGERETVEHGALLRAVFPAEPVADDGTVFALIEVEAGLMPLPPLDPIAPPILVNFEQ